MQKKNLIQLSQVSKSFPLASGVFHALKVVNLTIQKGQLVSITGKSGSGKSTLLNIITGIDKPTEGSVSINDVRVDKLSESELADLFSEGNKEKIRTALPRMTPAFRQLAEKVLAMEEK